MYLHNKQHIYGVVPETLPTGPEAAQIVIRQKELAQMYGM